MTLSGLLNYTNLDVNHPDSRARQAVYRKEFIQLCTRGDELYEIAPPYPYIFTQI